MYIPFQLSILFDIDPLRDIAYPHPSSSTMCSFAIYNSFYDIENKLRFGFLLHGQKMTIYVERSALIELACLLLFLETLFIHLTSMILRQHHISNISILSAAFLLMAHAL